MQVAGERAFIEGARVKMPGNFKDSGGQSGCHRVSEEEGD